MPHVHISYPHRAKDGTKRVQGETVYVTSAEARTLVADGKGKVVTPTPQEVVKLAEASKPKAEKPKAKEEGPKPLPKRPVPAKTEKPADG